MVGFFMNRDTVFYAARWARIVMATIFVGAAGEISLLVTPGRMRTKVYWRYVRLWGRSFLRGYRYSIEGVANIPPGPVVFAINHQSNFDIALLYALMPVRFRWMSKRSLFKVPFIGAWLRRMGAVEVARRDRKKAYRALYDAIETIKQGFSIVIFPEGTWGDRKGRMRRFKRGVVVMSERTGAPVTPVTIVGSSDANPPFTMKIHRAEMKVIIHPPVSSEELSEMTEIDALDYLRTIIAGPLPHGADIATPHSCEDETIEEEEYLDENEEAS